MKILVIRFSSIGDIVLTTPVLRCLKQQRPDIEIHYAIKQKYAWLLKANPYIDEFKFLGKNLLTYVLALRKERYDLIIDLHHNLRTFIVKRALGVKAHSFYKLNIEKWLYTRFKWNRLPPAPKVHIVNRYMDTVRSLGVEKDEKRLDYFIPADEEVDIRKDLPEPFHQGYVAYATGGQHATKRLPLERMIALCDKINRPIVLLGGDEDKAVADQIATFFAPKQNAAEETYLREEMDKKTKIFNACGRYSFHGSASLLRQSDLVFAHDTGMMHTASALGKTIYSIWGNTVPALGMYPYNAKFFVLENKNLACRPCSKIGYSRCPKGHFKCMKELPLDF